MHSKARDPTWVAAFFLERAVRTGIGPFDAPTRPNKRVML